MKNDIKPISGPIKSRRSPRMTAEEAAGQLQLISDVSWLSAIIGELSGKISALEPPSESEREMTREELLEHWSDQQVIFVRQWEARTGLKWTGF